MTTYFVSTTGNDTTGGGSQSLPYRTIANGLSRMVGGDTLYIRAGSYSEVINDTVPSGSSWTSPTTISRYGSEVVTLNPIGTQSIITVASSHCYIVFNGLILDGINQTPRSSVDWRSNYDGFVIKWSGTNYGTAGHHIRFTNGEIKNSPGQGIRVDINSHHCELLNSKVHDNGIVDMQHGFYWKSADGLIENCEFYNNSGWGGKLYNETAWELYPVNNCIVRSNYFHDNARVGARGRGIVVSQGSGAKIYNNIFRDNNGGIQVDYDVNNVYIYNNTIYHNIKGIYGQGIYIGNTRTTGTIIKNNIIYANTWTIVDVGIGTVQSNNLVINPLFVNAGTSDFHLQSGSSAIGYGVNLSSIFNTDYDGNARQSIGMWDAGAYMYGGTAPPPPPVVDTTPPLVSITNPQSGSTVSGIINLTALVYDL